MGIAIILLVSAREAYSSSLLASMNIKRNQLVVCLDSFAR